MWSYELLSNVRAAGIDRDPSGATFGGPPARLTLPDARCHIGFKTFAATSGAPALPAGAARTAASADRGGPTAKRSGRIRRSAGIKRHCGSDQSSVNPREVGERAFGVQSAGKVLQHGAECSAASSSFRRVDQQVQRGVFGIGGQGVNGDRHAVKLTHKQSKYEGVQRKSYIYRYQRKCRNRAYVATGAYVAGQSVK